LFGDWAEEWWAVWSSNPRRSPAALQTTESHLRLHLRPSFAGRRLGAISVQVVRRWQHELEAKASYDLTMACRSVLFRIMQAAEDDYLIPFNPVRKVKAPKRPVDPEAVFGRVRRRAYTPEEFGRFLAAGPAFYRDHFLVQVGTGLRSGELLGLRARRVDLARRRIEVVDVRYDAGCFGGGYKDRPKSDASIRPVPVGGAVAAALARRLDGCPPDGLVFCGPGGGNRVPRGTRSELSVGNYRRVYDRTVARAGLKEDLDLRGPQRPAPHLRHVAGGQRRPGSGDRRADGPPRRPASRRRRQCHRAALSAHDRRDAGARARGHRPVLGGGASSAGAAAVTLFVTVSGRSPSILSATGRSRVTQSGQSWIGKPAEGPGMHTDAKSAHGRWRERQPGRPEHHPTGVVPMVTCVQPRP
jgi:integrase